MEGAACHGEAVARELLPVEIHIAVHGDIVHAEFVTVDIDIAVDGRTLDVGIALHHHIAVDGNLALSLQTVSHNATLKVNPFRIPDAGDVEILRRINIVLDALARIGGLGAVEILYAGVFPQVHIAVDAEFGDVAVEDIVFLVVEKDGLTEAVLEIDAELAAEQVALAVHVSSFNQVETLGGVVPHLHICAVVVVAVEQSYEHAAVGIEVAVNHGVALRRREEIDFRPVVVPAFGQRSSVDVDGFCVPHQRGLRCARLHFAVHLVAQDGIVLPHHAIGDYPSALIPHILPGNCCGVTAVRAGFLERHVDHIVSAFARVEIGDHFSCAVQEIGKRGLRDIYVPVCLLRDYGGDRRLQAEDIVEDLFELLRRLVRTRDDGA